MRRTVSSRLLAISFSLSSPGSGLRGFGMAGGTNLSLTGALKLKLERAEHHVLDLKRQVNDYLIAADIHLVDRIDHKAHERVLLIKKNIPIPDVFSLIIGDAAHNLRSCLDIAMFNILARHIEAIDPKGVDHIHFPI